MGKEEAIGKEYEDLWADPKKIKRHNRHVTLGWHLGFYEHGVKSYNEAVINMNNYVGKLLNITDNSSRILDAGCGVGATTIHLAAQYPNCHFFGITLSKNELAYAEKLKAKYKLTNTTFFQQSYYYTKFPSRYFDGVFALESACYANEKLFLKEMKRILKENGKLVVIDFFRTCDVDNRYIRAIVTTILKEQNYVGRRTIFTFKEQLTHLKFTQITSTDLLQTGNVKWYFVYGFLFQYLFKHLLEETKENIRKKKTHSFLSIGIFLYRFFFRMIILLLTRTRYYAITAVKSHS